jgi:hypothetical protein
MPEYPARRYFGWMGWNWVPGVMDSLDGIEPYEVSQVLGSAKRWPRPGASRDTGIGSLTIWGRTWAGRPMMIGVRLGPGLDMQVYAARELTAAQVTELEKWEATR